MNKDDTYYLLLLEFARQKLGSYAAVSKALNAPSGPAVQAWRKNGVAHKWRPVLDKLFGAAFRKSLIQVEEAVK
jgi:hypothetical protein